jgi:hypothetical protein
MSLQNALGAFRADFEVGGPPCNAPDWIHEPMGRGGVGNPALEVVAEPSQTASARAQKPMLNC